MVNHDEPRAAKNDPSILTRRGFLRTLGLIVTTAVVVPAVLVDDERLEVSAETHVKLEDGWTHVMVFCDRSGETKTYVNGKRQRVSFRGGEYYEIEKNLMYNFKDYKQCMDRSKRSAPATTGRSLDRNS